MKKFLPLIILAGLALFLFGWVKGFYNTGVALQEDTKEQWGNVQSAYQKRADLIPNIMNTAKGYAQYEQETFTKVIEARSKATSIQIDPSNITPEQLAQFQQAQSGLTSALSRLLAVFERYPDLKANENFKELINELERTEAQIKVERDRFNEKVKPFNNHVRQFPGNLLAGMFKFNEMDYFEADKGTEKAPKVEFDFGK